jgi:hypothetical protein
MMAALGAAVMLIGGFLAIATYAAPLFASVLLIPVLVEFGKGRAWLCYLATAIVCALICPDKELAFFYAVIGFYPIIRSFFERIPGRFPRTMAKLAYFAVSTAVLYLFLCFVLKLEALLSELGKAGALMNAVFFAVLVAALLIYDAAVGAAHRIYLLRIRPKLKFLGK